MEAINGVTFADWGAACGNLAQGMSEEEVCQVLGIELPVWQKTNDAWTGKLGDLMAEVHSANIAGVDFAELQKLKAMRDMAKNEGAAGAGMGMFAGMNMGNTMGQSQQQDNIPSAQTDICTKLKELKALFEDDLISEEEFQSKKQQLLDQM